MNIIILLKKNTSKLSASKFSRRGVVRDGGAEATERPDGLLPEAGAARGQRVRGGAAQGEETVQHSLLDTIIGITGQANIKSASKYFCVRILFGVSIIFSGGF